MLRVGLALLGDQVSELYFKCSHGDAGSPVTA